MENAHILRYCFVLWFLGDEGELIASGILNHFSDILFFHPLFNKLNEFFSRWLCDISRPFYFDFLLTKCNRLYNCLWNILTKKFYSFVWNNLWNKLKKNSDFFRQSFNSGFFSFLWIVHFILRGIKRVDRRTFINLSFILLLYLLSCQT
jgi:hypothetical protein